MTMKVHLMEVMILLKMLINKFGFMTVKDIIDWKRWKSQEGNFFEDTK